jgi:hypothetical protein
VHCTIQIKHFGAWKAGHFSSKRCNPTPKWHADRAELGWRLGFTHIRRVHAVVGATQLLLSITTAGNQLAALTFALMERRAAQSARVLTDTTKRATMSESNCVSTSHPYNERLVATHTYKKHTHTNTEMDNFIMYK